MEIKKVFKYWGYVIRKARESALEKSEMKGWIKASLVAGITAGIIWTLAKAGFISSDTPFVGDIIGNLGVQFGLGVGALVVFGVAFFFGLIYVPAEVYEEMGGFVENPYELSSEPHPDNIVPGDYVRAINVRTTTPFDITECRLELLEAKNIDTDENVLRRREFLEWSGREGNNQREPKTIRGNGQSRLCNISFWLMQSRVAFFTLVDDHARKIPEGTYLLKIEVTGKWQGHNIRHKEPFFLKYENNIIQLGNKLDELDNDISEVSLVSEKQIRAREVPINTTKKKSSSRKRIS